MPMVMIGNLTIVHRPRARHLVLSLLLYGGFQAAMIS